MSTSMNNKNVKRFVLGVCGRIASGKTEVLKILGKNGWVVIDADKIVHELYKPSKIGQRRVCDFFGEEFLKKDGSVDRVKLRKAVFNDVKKLKILNTLIHPLVFNEIVKILDEKFPKIAIESVYFEDKFLNKLVDKILWVDRPVNKIKDCLIKKRGLRTDVANKILALDIIPKKIDLRINNNSTLKELQKKVIIAVEKF